MGSMHPCPLCDPLDEFNVADVALHAFQASKVLPGSLGTLTPGDCVHHRNLTVRGCHVEKDAEKERP